MALPVRESASPMDRIHDEIDRMFHEFNVGRFWPRSDLRIPSCDVYEKNGSLLVEAELPGIQRKDVKVHYTDNTITIRGESKQEKQEKKDGYYRSERQYGSFFRSIPLPTPVDFSKATAAFKDGILKVTLPKAEKPAQAERTIPISE